jgi:V8-like Glu-specific endopeptidase
MNTKFAACTIAIAAAITASIPAAAQATGAAAPAAAALNPNTIMTDTISDSAVQVNAYWTPGRLAAAKDMNLLPAAQPARPPSAIPPGPVQSMPPAAPAAGAAGAIPASLPGKHSRVWANRLVKTAPASTVGQLYFKDGSGKPGRCTATVISAPNKGTIWTAAHCVSDGSGHWYKDFVFQPGRHGNTAPWGGFVGKVVAAPAGYVTGNLASYDYAGIALYPSLRGKIENLTGSQGWIMGGNRYNWPGLYIFGYPAKLYPGPIPVNGNILRYCTGPTAEDSGKLMMLFHCDMGNGSSGGPLLYRMKKGGGWLVGDISIGDTRNYTRWSPQLDAIALVTYRDVYRK